VLFYYSIVLNMQQLNICNYSYTIINMGYVL
jgi:hypothetical protein